jgi:CCR4-NOT transcription complex subunit 7/8
MSLSMITLREVWSHNLEEEFDVIRRLIEYYPFVAMDTVSPLPPSSPPPSSIARPFQEYPGIVEVPKGRFKSKQDFNYQNMRVNVNQLKLIQVGMTFVNERGELPPGNAVWQFNFHFNSRMDAMARDSGELLREAGIDFYRHQVGGLLMALVTGW